MPCIADYAIALPLLYLYVTDYRTPGKVREYLETLASKTPSWNEVCRLFSSSCTARARVCVGGRPRELSRGLLVVCMCVWWVGGWVVRACQC